MVSSDDDLAKIAISSGNELLCLRISVGWWEKAMNPKKVTLVIRLTIVNSSPSRLGSFCAI